MDALTLEQEALKLTPLSRIRLADLLYTSLEVEADREWNRNHRRMRIPLRGLQERGNGVE